MGGLGALLPTHFRLEAAGRVGGFSSSASPMKRVFAISADSASRSQGSECFRASCGDSRGKGLEETRVGGVIVPAEGDES